MVLIIADQRVIKHACDSKTWQDQRRARVCLVNISPQEFRQRNFPEMVEIYFAETGLPATCLELEITESTVMDSAEATVEMLRRLKARGDHLGD